ncbi:hypothetical protein GYMLUDRAFT_918481 [Collybiopsis luxurians FD-317 M1]|uniref:Uncharacterized protein n=1 Tax=Collybiopsis luxurians FD-317 M1 TaxID=944289 RepID=A0A0D0CGU5_9AGAR|nr:hypothetical protein GYMLUDRAFT_918481 [Collybiopsis luxurians FD-317 M1]
MNDGESAYLLKPDIVGVLGKEAPETLFRSPPYQEENEVVIPVQIKNDWQTLVLQAGIYAHCMFSASPLRQLVLIFGSDHVQHYLRFLVYHRGALTASNPLNLNLSEGQRTLSLCFSLSSLGKPAEMLDSQHSATKPRLP